MATRLPVTGRIAPAQLTAGSVPQVRVARDPGLRRAGVQVGQGIVEGLGRISDAGLEQIQRQENASRRLEVARADAETQIQTNKLFNQLKTERDPDTFVQKMEEGLEDIAAQQLEKFQNDEIAERAYRIGFQNFRGNVISQAQNTAREIRRLNNFTQTEDMVTTLLNEADSALANGDEVTRQNYAEQISNLIDSAQEAGFYTPEQASQRRESVAKDMVRGRFEFLLNNNPNSAETFIQGESAEILSLEERQKLAQRARDTEFLQIRRSQILDEQQRKANERILKKRQQENYSKHLIKANRGQLDLEEIEQDLISKNITNEQFNSLNNIDFTADSKQSQNRLVDYESSFRQLEDIGSRPLDTQGVSKQDMIDQMRSDIQSDQTLTANDKLKAEQRLQNIENNTQITESQRYKTAKDLINQGFGTPESILDDTARQRAVAARYEFSRRVFENGEDPLEVATELLDLEQNTFKSLDSPFFKARVDAEMSGIPQRFHSFTSIQGKTVPSPENMRALLKDAGAKGKLTAGEAVQFSERIDELERILEPFQQQKVEEPEPPPPPPEPTLGDRFREFTEETKTFFQQNLPTIIDQVLRDRGLIGPNGQVNQNAQESQAQSPEQPAEIPPSQKVEQTEQEPPSTLSEEDLMPQLSVEQDTNVPSITTANPLENGKDVDPKIVTAIEESASKYKLPAALIKAIIAQESSFDPKAKNTEQEGNTAVGLMQVTDAAAKDVGLDPEKPRTNIKKNVGAGSAFLRKMVERFKGDGVKKNKDLWILATAGFHVGPTVIADAIQRASEKKKELTAQNVISEIEPPMAQSAAAEYINKINSILINIGKNG